MRFSESWLREWINPPVDTAMLAHRLTMAGLEVDAIDPAAEPFTGVVIADVLSVEPHPDADKLKITRVTDGTSEYQIVCGAANVRSGMRVPLATLGAKLPGGIVIKSAKLRGVPSEGMLCGASELGMPSAVDGLWELPADAPLGQSIRDWLNLDDAIIELGITPNRGDALSILGVARDCSALFNLDITPKDQSPIVQINSDEVQPARIDAPDDCPVYLTQVVTGLSPARQTPMWLSERLRRAGIKVIEPVVDICNYVMLELGQPLHAFDQQKLQGDLTVRRAHPDESLLALNQQELALDAACLVIADSARPVALAGIIGGQDSAVSAHTTDIVLESAHFTPEVIAGRARRLGLTTDAAYRFERGVDPLIPARALSRAAALIQQICGGQVGKACAAEGSHAPRVPAPIVLDLEWATRRLGLKIEPEQAKNFLIRLGCAVAFDSDTVMTVTPPSHRFDLVIPEDLLEELARLLGFDAFRAPMGCSSLTIGVRPETENSSASIADFMASQGYFEAISYSFIDPALATLFSSDTGLALANPISSEMAVMRQSLWPGLLQAVAFNQNRQQSRVRLFEIGRSFSGTIDDVREIDQLAAVLTGSRWPEQWGEKSTQADFFDLKGDCEALLVHLGFTLEPSSGSAANVRFEAATHPALHPGQTAQIIIQGQPCGWIGEIHPLVAEKTGVNGPVLVLELDLAALQKRQLPANKPRSRFPQVRRDLALLKPADMPIAELLSLIRDGSPASLRAVGVFDRYVGTGIEPGLESVAVKLIFQESERTLTDDEIVGIISDIRAKLAQHHIQLRS